MNSGTDWLLARDVLDPLCVSTSSANAHVGYVVSGTSSGRMTHAWRRSVMRHPLSRSFIVACFLLTSEAEAPMTIAMIFDAKGVTLQQYTQVTNELKMTENMPKGMIEHVAGPSEGGWTVIELWESEADARAFFDDRLGAALKRANISVQPKVFAVHARMSITSKSKAA